MMTNSKTIYTVENQKHLMKSFVNVSAIIEQIALILEQEKYQKTYLPEVEYVDSIEKIRDLIHSYEIGCKLDEMDGI